MPAKIARLATRPPFWIPEVSVAVRSSRPSCSKAEKREYSWQIGSHPGNPGLAVIEAVSTLNVFFQTPHRAMPNLILETDQKNDIIAYILSLKK